MRIYANYFCSYDIYHCIITIEGKCVFTQKYSMIKRDKYLRKLIERRHNGLIKIITGIRRCGKSYLLSVIYRNFLIESGVSPDDIIMLSLEDTQNARYRNPIELDSYIRSLVSDSSRIFYVFIDEIQMAGEVENPYLKGDKITFVSTLLSLMKIPNIDIYVTGSNSRMLSSDIVTEFRDKGDEIRMSPLSFSEFYSAMPEVDKNTALSLYIRYGGMPRILQFHDNEDKALYLNELFTKTYLSDIIERHDIRNDKIVLDDILNVIALSVGFLISVDNISNTLKSVRRIDISANTVKAYLGYFKDAYILSKVGRYDVKGRKHIGAGEKYFFSDTGLRNSRLSFSQVEENHLMENIIYNELLYRGYEVSVGSVTYNYKDEEGRSKRSQLEIDFIAEKNGEKLYIQSAFIIPDEEKRNQETASLRRVRDSFKKIMILRHDILPTHDEYGILYLSLSDFLLDENAVRL